MEVSTEKVGLNYSVYCDPAMYAGWPANHGAWQWGDEFLVGFLRGPYRRGSMHNIALPFEKVLARSLDGGRTWNVEVPNVDFECLRTTEAPPFDLSKSIIRVCGVYDHGGDDCDLHGGFYLSHDKGETWEGAYKFSGIEFDHGDICTARTCVLGNTVFLSQGDEYQWGVDRIFLADHDGEKFTRRPELPFRNGRMVMPAAVWVDDETLVLVARRRSGADAYGWIEAFRSGGGGDSWESVCRVGTTGKDNGNPPALIESRGVLYCCFANRSEGSIDVSVSRDAGLTWSKQTPIRSGGLPDIGYPRLFLRSDGTPVCVYYWADGDNRVQRIEATEIPQ